MNANGWIQFALYVAALLLITKPLGLYLTRVLDARGKTFLDPVFKPIERLTYKVLRVDPEQEHDWKQYTIAMLIFSFVTMLFTYGILRLQDVLPLNPQKLAALSEHLSFNTAASFTTNTNWQNYGGETTMSYFSQMVGLASHNFLSAAVGIAIAAALVRGIARHTSKTIGNFWVDLTRVTYYLLLPICLIFAVVLVSQGMIQNFKPYDTVKLTESFTTQVAKVDDKGNPVLDATGQTGDGRQEDRHANDRAGSDGLADRDQNARNKWRRLCERERGASVRKSDAAFELPPDVLDLRHPERAHLLPRPNGEEPRATAGRCGRRCSWSL